MNALELYLLINVGILAAYSALRALKALNFLSAPPALSSKIALILLACGLFAPIGLHLAPQKSLPRLPLSFREPLAEASRARIRHRIHRLRADLPPKLADPETRWSAPEISWDLLARILGALLAVGSLIQFARAAMGWRKLSSLIEDSPQIRSLGRVSIRVSNEIEVPLSVLRLGSAEVLLPEALIARRLDTTIAVRHELQHHRQGDTAAAIALEILKALFFANPAIHAWRRELADLQEFACDEAVLGRRRVSAHAYGSCLVRVAEAALGGQAVYAGTACMAQSFGNPVRFKSVLRRRIEMVLKRQPGRRRAPAIILGTVAGAAVLAVALGAHQSLRGSEPEARPPNPGRLELDSQIQSIAENVLSKHMARRGAKAGFVIVSDPTTGRLLAVAQETQAKDNLDWALSYRFEPASIIKPVVAAAAIEEKATTLDEKHDCEDGSYEFGTHVFHDWRKFEELTTAGTLIQSSNICGIKVGEELGPRGLSKALAEFGFGPGGSAEQVAGARPGEFPAPGALARTDYIPLIATGYTGMGGFYVTPIELVQAYGAFANGGVLMKPYASSTESPHVIRRVLSPDNADDLRETLARAVEEGTGKNARSDLYTTAGKTSTAYAPTVPEHDTLGGETSIAGFIGFAPAENPRVLIFSILIDPKDKKVTGNWHAAPIFHDTAEAVLKYLGVPPDRAPAKP